MSSAVDAELSGCRLSVLYAGEIQRDTAVKYN